MQCRRDPYGPVRGRSSASPWGERVVRAAILVLAAALPFTPPVLAHDGEEHGDEQAAAAHMSEPRFEARSDVVEVTGILKGRDLWLFVTRFATNEPLGGLQVVIESGTGSTPAAAVGEGIYRVPAGAVGRRGRHAVVLTLRGGGIDELLAGELVIPAGQ